MKTSRLTLYAAFLSCAMLPGALFALSAATTPENTAPPEIAIGPDLYYPMDEILYLEGRALPDASIHSHKNRRGT